VKEQTVPAGKVLIADDDQACLDLVSRLMTDLGYEVVSVRDGLSALKAVGVSPPDLMLLDVEMPKADGFEVCRRLKNDPATRLIPIVLITGLDSSDDRVRGIEAGADDFIAKPFNVQELTARVRSLSRLKAFTDELESADSVILSLALTIEARDPYTQGHCERLARFASALGVRLSLDRMDRAALYRGGFLHDVGKIGVPDYVLLKPGPLTPDEAALMREHPVIGERLCGSLRSLELVRPIIRHHHERYDGSGYPDRLRGNDIPLLAQIVGIVDTFDAMTTDRPYRRARSRERAYAELTDERARGRLRPDLVEIFIDVDRSGEANGTTGNFQG
jgi:putative two-component system response regulator